MPLMTMIRERMSRIFAIFAGVFVVYIVLDWGMDITGRQERNTQAASQEVGSVGDRKISYRDFNALVQQSLENQRKQSNNEIDDNQQQMIRDQVWNQMVDEILYDEEAKRFNISVTNQEIVDMVRGDTPPEFLRTQFTDSTGTFNRQAYESAILNPKNKEIMLRVEDALRKQRMREKLQSAIFASVRVSDAEILQKFADQSIQYQAEYILLDPAQLVKEEIKPTDAEMRAYYSDHSSEYKVEPSRELKYVQFSNSPSKSDSESVLREMEDIRRRANEGVDFTDLAGTYSETPVTDVFYKHGELAQERELMAFSAKAGSIFGPILEQNGYHLVKVMEFRTGKDEFIHARHILITVDGNDTIAAMKLARDVYGKAKRGENFEELVRSYSKEPGAAERGGDLGWFGKGRMVKPFEDAVYKAKAGQIIGPVRTQFGYHIIEMLAKDNRELKLIDIHMPVNASATTRNDVGQRAHDFANAAKENGFEKEAANDGYKIIETPSFQKNGTIPGVGMEPGLSRFAFSGNVGDISEVMSLQSGFGVFMIAKRNDAGIRPFEEVKTSIEGSVRRQKQMEKMMTFGVEVRQSLSPSDSLQKVIQNYPGLQVQHLQNFTLGGFITGMGRDLKFIGAVSGLNAGQVSKPIEGQRGVYIIRLLSKSEFDSTAFNMQKQTLYAQLISEKKNRLLTEWSENLKNTAQIVDNRDLFYR